MKGLRNFLNRCMSEPDVNSRFIFFLNGVVVAVSTLILSIAFICSSHTDNYAEYLIALGAVGGGAAVGRYLTKKNQAGIAALADAEAKTTT